MPELRGAVTRAGHRPFASRALCPFLTQIRPFTFPPRPFVPLKPFSDKLKQQLRGNPDPPVLAVPVTPRSQLQAGAPVSPAQRRPQRDRPHPCGCAGTGAANGAAAAVPAPAPAGQQWEQSPRCRAAPAAEPLPRGPPPGPERRNLSGHILEAAAAGPGMRPGEPPGSAPARPQGPSRRGGPEHPGGGKGGKGPSGRAKLPPAPGSAGRGGGPRRGPRRRGQPLATVNGAGPAAPAAPPPGPVPHSPLE